MQQLPPNYFAFYDLPISFLPDLTLLKRRFYENSRRFHPDFFAQTSAEQQEQALTWATYNNEAYKTLANFDERMRYILTLARQITDNEKYELPQDYLFAMMDINEAIDELQHAPDSQKAKQLQQEVEDIANDLYHKVLPYMQNFGESDLENSETLKKVKEFYYKKRYLLRIQEMLLKFAPS